MDFVEIPVEIFSNIFSFIDTKSLYSMSKINSTTRKCFEENQILWKNRSFKFSEIKNYKMLKIIESLEIDKIPHSKIIDLSKIEGNFPTKIIRMAIQNVETECIIRSIFVSFLSMSNNVENLFIDFPINDGWVYSITKNCQKLSKLSLRNELFKLRSKIHPNPSLKHLEFNIYGELSNFDGSALLPMFPNLVSLSVRFSSMFSILLHYGQDEADLVVAKLHYLTFIWSKACDFQWVTNARFVNIPRDKKPFKTVKLIESDQFNKFVMINNHLIDAKNTADCEEFSEEICPTDENSNIRILQIYEIDNEIVLDIDNIMNVKNENYGFGKITVGIKRK